jgi:hypothetical protein
LPVNDSEYQALRAEILGWQGHRITIATWTVVVVTAVLGWIIQAPHRWAWPDGSAILMATLASAAILTRILGLNALRLGTYLEVFYEADEPGWESRNRVVRKGRAWENLNTGIAIIYTALGAVSIAVPILATDRTPSAGSYVVFALAVCAAGGAVVLLVMPGERGRQLERWEKVRDDERKQTGTPDDSS